MSDSDDDHLQIVRKKRRALPNIRTFLDDEAEHSDDDLECEFDGSPVEGLFCGQEEENETPPSPTAYRRLNQSSCELEEDEEDVVFSHYRKMQVRLCDDNISRLDSIIRAAESAESPTQFADDDDQSVVESVVTDRSLPATQSVVASQSDDAIAEVVQATRADRVSKGVCVADDRCRKATWAITFFPQVNPGDVVRLPSGEWTLVEEARERFKGFPVELQRVIAHPYSPVMAMGGQYECAPSTGTFHFQGWFQCYAKDNSKNYKPSAPNCASRLRSLIADDQKMFTVDGLRLHNVIQKFDVMPCSTSPRQLRDYCESEFKDGRPKRAFPHAPLYYSVFNDPADAQDAAKGSALDQVVALGMSGVPYLDMVAKTGKVGFMHTRNYQTLVSAVEAKKPRLESRCQKWWCRHPPVTEVLGRRLAEKRGMDYNEFNAKIGSGCGTGIIYSYGQGGTGKSTFSKLVALWQNKGSVYFKLPGEFWGAVNGESYNGQTGVVFHEMGPHYFPGKYPLLEFKRIVDCTDCSVPTKNGNAVLRATNFYMDSNYDPVQLFAMLLPPRMTELEAEIEYGAYSRRFKQIFYYSKPNSAFPGPTRVIGKSMPPWTSIRSFLMTSLQQQTRTGISADSNYSMPDQVGIVDLVNTHRYLEEEALMYQTEQELLL